MPRQNTSRCLASLLLFPLSLLLASCVSDPVVDPGNGMSVDAPEVLVLCEGVWNADNATMAAIDLDSAAVERDWFGAVNPGLRIGDMANDFLLLDSVAVIAVSGSNYLEVLSLPSGEHIRRITLAENTFPVALASADGSTVWVTALDSDLLLAVNVHTGVVLEEIPVGPAPEGVAVDDNRVVVANSGLGALRAQEEGAGEIWVIDPVTRSVTRRIPAGSNPGEVFLDDTRNVLLVVTRTVPPDTGGGAIVILAADSYQELGRVPIAGLRTGAYDVASGRFLGLGSSGVVAVEIDVVPYAAQTLLQIAGSTLTEEVVHSIEVEQGGEHFWLGIATGYFQGPGRVERYRGTTEVAEFQVGVNPTAFAFPE